MSADELIFASAAAIAQAIRSRIVSSEEVVGACLDRIAAVNGALNAVVRLNPGARLIGGKMSAWPWPSRLKPQRANGHARCSPGPGRAARLAGAAQEPP